MTLAQVQGYVAALNQLDMGQLKLQAIAARAGQADEKSWKKWLDGMA